MWAEVKKIWDQVDKIVKIIRFWFHLILIKLLNKNNAADAKLNPDSR